MGRKHKRTPVRNWLYGHYYLDTTGIWPRIRGAVERNGGLHATMLDIMGIMVAVCCIGIIAIGVWMAVSGTLTWP